MTAEGTTTPPEPITAKERIHDIHELMKALTDLIGSVDRKADDKTRVETVIDRTYMAALVGAALSVAQATVESTEFDRMKWEHASWRLDR